jgi:hypothetical protein
LDVFSTFSCEADAPVIEWNLLLNGEFFGKKKKCSNKFFWWLFGNKKVEGEEEADDAFEMQRLARNKLRNGGKMVEEGKFICQWWVEEGEYKEEWPMDYFLDSIEFLLLWFVEVHRADRKIDNINWRKVVVKLDWTQT